MKKQRTVMMILLLVLAVLALGGRVLASEPVPEATLEATTVTFPDGVAATLSQQQPTQVTAVVPAGVVDGNVSLNTASGTSNPAPFLVGEWFTPDPANAAATAAITASGTLTEDTVWDQDILLTGDVIIPVGITLTIEPGVTVLFAAQSDDQADGYWPDAVELHAHGTLTAVGTPAHPIYFTSNAATPAARDWAGILIYKNNPNAHLSYCSVEYSHIGISFYNRSAGAGLSSGTVDHCTIQNSRFGIHIFNRSGSGTLTTDVTVAHNLVRYNEYGIRVLVHMGAGAGVDTSRIYNNRVTENGSGIQLFGHHWGGGSTTIQTEVRNNFSYDNNQNNLYLRMQDGKATLEPVIENNLLRNTTAMTNTNLLIEGISNYGGSNRVFSPTIRYNTFANAAHGLLMTTNVDDMTMAPHINHNIFYALSEFAVSNVTTYTVSVEQNYWGSNDAAWDAGVGSMVTGTLTTTNHLTASSAPILTHVGPGLAQSGTSVTLYGANLGEATSPTYNLFLPMIVK